MSEDAREERWLSCRDLSAGIGELVRGQLETRRHHVADKNLLKTHSANARELNGNMREGVLGQDLIERVFPHSRTFATFSRPFAIVLFLASYSFTMVLFESPALTQRQSLEMAARLR
jgi:hypothetical protein